MLPSIHRLLFSVLFDCSVFGSSAVGFAVRFGTGTWKSVVLFALVKGVLHCFKLEIINTNVWHLGLEINYFTDRSRTNIALVKVNILVIIKAVFILHLIS